MPRQPTIESRLAQDISLEIEQANADALRLDELMLHAPAAQRDQIGAQAEAAHDRLKAAEALMKKIAANE